MKNVLVSSRAGVWQCGGLLGGVTSVLGLACVCVLLGLLCLLCAAGVRKLWAGVHRGTEDAPTVDCACCYEMPRALKAAADGGKTEA